MLAVDGLGFRYRGGQELFDGLSHEFPTGAMSAVTGRSGRGKSTLLYLLGMMLQPNWGRILLDGNPVHDLPDATRSWMRANRIGFVFQDAVLDPTRTVLESVLEPVLWAGGRRQHARARAAMLLREMGLGIRVDHRPGEISGGQAQRAAICRALINNPDIILADEPTGNLDRDNAATVLAALRDATRTGRTVIIATHDPYVLDRVDHTLPL